MFLNLEWLIFRSPLYLGKIQPPVLNIVLKFLSTAIELNCYFICQKKKFVTKLEEIKEHICVALYQSRSIFSNFIFWVNLFKVQTVFCL